jgi:prepilin-type N-terminal cleavage/methylation domain-containing protein
LCLELEHPGKFSEKMIKHQKKNGFTLLELVLVMGILAVLTTVGFGYYRNFARSIELESTSATLTSDLKTAQAKSMSGTDNRKWGIHAVNGPSDYYELFSTPSNYADPLASVSETTFLPGGITFASPGEGLTRDIIFGKITGTATPASLSLMYESTTRDITVKSQGIIY